MEINKYDSIQGLVDSAISRGLGVYDCGTSVSFRIYDKLGNTTEFHVYYR